MSSSANPACPPAIDLFVPGRICLFGEHSDWAGGYRQQNSLLERGHTLTSGTDQGIHARVEAHPTSLVLTATTPGGQMWGPHEIALAPQALLAEAQSGSFWSYCAGVAYQIQHRYAVSGLRIHNYHTDLPIRKGLSSSAAISVLTARAFNLVYELGLTIRDEMELAYLGEITTPSRCGRMDQGCAFGKRVVLMTFDGDGLHTREVSVGSDLFLVIADLGAEKNTRKILDCLNRCYPAGDTALASGVQDLLGPTNRRVVHEALEALATGDSRWLGALMDEAQSLFDRYATPVCPEELVAPRLHQLLSYAPLRPHVWGGKGVGSQGDGAAQFVARSQEHQKAAIDLLERSLGLRCLELTLPASTGARVEFHHRHARLEHKEGA